MSLIEWTRNIEFLCSRVKQKKCDRANSRVVCGSRAGRGWSEDGQTITCCFWLDFRDGSEVLGDQRGKESEITVYTIITEADTIQYVVAETMLQKTVNERVSQIELVEYREAGRYKRGHVAQSPSPAPDGRCGPAS